MMSFVAVALTACDPCYNVECDAPDTDSINALYFAFDPNHFTTTEIDRAYVLRFAPTDLAQPIDTLYIGQQATAGNGVFRIGMGSFANAVDFAQFTYGIYANTAEYAYIITDITTQGHYPTDCCCCYRNRTKTFTLNGQGFDRSASTEAVVLGK